MCLAACAAKAHALCKAHVCAGSGVHTQLAARPSCFLTMTPGTGVRSGVLTLTATLPAHAMVLLMHVGMLRYRALVRFPLAKTAMSDVALPWDCTQYVYVWLMFNPGSARFSYISAVVGVYLQAGRMDQERKGLSSSSRTYWTIRKAQAWP